MPQVQVGTVKRGNGAYRVAAVSGVITGASAATATAGHLFAVRWSPPVGDGPQVLVLQRLRARWFTLAGFTSGQEVGLDLSVLRSYTVGHTGGTSLTLTTNNAKKRTSMPTTAVAGIRVATTGDLTAGTHTFDAQPIAQASFSELAAGATVPKGVFDMSLSTEDLDRYPVVLAANEGLCIRNSILMGTGGTARLVVEMDWLELVRY